MKLKMCCKKKKFISLKVLKKVFGVCSDTYIGIILAVILKNYRWYSALINTLSTLSVFNFLFPFLWLIHSYPPTQQIYFTFFLMAHTAFSLSLPLSYLSILHLLFWLYIHYLNLLLSFPFFYCSFLYLFMSIDMEYPFPSPSFPSPQWTIYI